LRLFVDSSGWIALSATGDKFYEVASRNFGAIRDEPLKLVTSDYVLDESLTNVQRHFGHRGAVEFGSWVLGNDRVEVARVDEDIWEAAWEMFQAYEDKEWSFTDCTSFVLMQRRQLYLAFSFDYHFKQAGFQLWPTLS
jgi:predicted nucleic acid-binding protein